MKRKGKKTFRTGTKCCYKLYKLFLWSRLRENNLAVLSLTFLINVVILIIELLALL